VDVTASGDIESATKFQVFGISYNAHSSHCFPACWPDNYAGLGLALRTSGIVRVQLFSGNMDLRKDTFL